jgi:Ser/Thr protein kinase RdoA (MazF antagonist)
VLDFGDIVRSSVVGDLAVAMTYAVDSAAPGSDPWAPAYDVARGFVSVRTLTDDESALLPDLLRTRLAQRLLLNSWLAASDPSNAHYTARTVHRAVVSIQRLRAVAPPQATALVKES